MLSHSKTTRPSKMCFIRNRLSFFRTIQIPQVENSLLFIKQRSHFFSRFYVILQHKKTVYRWVLFPINVYHLGPISWSLIKVWYLRFTSRHGNYNMSFIIPSSETPRAFPSFHRRSSLVVKMLLGHAFQFPCTHRRMDDRRLNKQTGNFYALFNRPPTPNPQPLTPVILNYVERKNDHVSPTVYHYYYYRILLTVRKIFIHESIVEAAFV